MKPLARLSARWARMRIGTKLISAFGMLLALSSALGAVSFISLAEVNKASSALADKWLPGVGHMSTARAAMLEAREFEVKHSRAADASYMAEYEEKMAAAIKTVDASLAAYRKLVNSADETKLADVLSKAWGDYLAVNKKVVALSRASKQDDAREVGEGAAKMSLDDAVSALDGLTAFNFKGGKATDEHAHVVYARAKFWVLGLIAAALLIGLALAVVITRGLLRQLGGEPGVAAEVARAVAGGDLTSVVPVKDGDTGSLMARLQEMQASLAQVVTRVREGSENVSIASAEIAQGNSDLSGRTEQQASALEQTAATMDELASTVRNNADNAKQANQLALGASNVAVKGGEVVGQVVETMKGINDSSRKIADIIGVIDGIAFQTNILALNAAVEAARAGEQGRGFAVVAGEVRSLAQRSAEAAKEIKSLIGASVERVEQGTSLVDQAGATMSEIVGAIKRVSDIVAEISSASVEQSAGVGEVGQAITQMDQTTQQNAALVEQSAAAAESLKMQAAQLVQAVAVFKLNGSAARVLAPAAPATPAPPATPGNYAGAERRGPTRATNVTRPAFGVDKKHAAAAAPAAAATAKTGTDDDWTTF